MSQRLLSPILYDKPLYQAQILVEFIIEVGPPVIAALLYAYNIAAKVEVNRRTIDILECQETERITL